MSVTETPDTTRAHANRADVHIGPSMSALGVLLLLRISGFALFQSAIALIYLMLGSDEAWTRSAAWWPYTATATSIVTLIALHRMLAREGRRYRDLLRFRSDTWRRDAVVTLGITVAALVLATVPNAALGALLFGDPTTPLDMLMLPLPTGAAAGALLLFPLTVAASELPLYAGYLRPRLESRTRRPALAVALTAGWLTLQHATLPLLFDAHFLTWRALMFAPFASFVIVVARRRPRLLPYLVIVHFIADLGTAAQVWAVASGW